MQEKTAIIIGAGPAGLTAAYELAERSGVRPVVLEADTVVGGISRTVRTHGNRLDIGGHRFFTKSQRVLKWWLRFLPLEAANGTSTGLTAETTDRVMLQRRRRSRILYGGMFIEYPIALNAATLKMLGPVKIAKVLAGYIRARLMPVKEVRSLEDFYINRFGRELYETFFKDYTEKVFGMPTSELMPEWGAQRVKGLSITRTLVHALKKALGGGSATPGSNVESTLIDSFMYPKFGPGQMWELVAEAVTDMGGELHLNHKAVGLGLDGNRVAEVRVRDEATGEIKTLKADYVFSTMAVDNLISAMGEDVPEEVAGVACALRHRGFAVVGLLLKRMKLAGPGRKLVPDNWIYIQESDVRVGRLQIFNNWSPYLVADPDTVWLGAEYFCDIGDELWNLPDEDFVALAVRELSALGIIEEADMIDGTVVRMPDAYPIYAGAFEKFDVVREFTDKIENLFLIGRNGMHRYNNMDHSMLTAMQAVDNIIAGDKDKSSIWSVNADSRYHEGK